ncbi:13611_t:CDS:2 [Entrophospora sp. SA101]|nr:13611_t:CDS:2 [Entrophospora sp. SA101]
MIFMRTSYKQQSVDPATKNIEKAILALNNEISKMRTESEWKSETQSLEFILMSLTLQVAPLLQAIDRNIHMKLKLPGLNLPTSLTKEEKEKGRSPATMYNVLSEEIRLGPATLSGFYHHQKKPHVTTLDKIEAWY